MSYMSRGINRYEAEHWQDADCTNCLKANTVMAPSLTRDAVYTSFCDMLYSVSNGNAILVTTYLSQPEPP